MNHHLSVLCGLTLSLSIFWPTPIIAANITTLYSFTGQADSYGPVGNLAFDPAGNLYGATPGGSGNDYGTIFELAAGSHQFTTLYSFNFSSGVGMPYGGLTADSVGNLYGTTSANQGTVFKVAANTHQLTTLATLNHDEPTSPLVFDNAGNLFGTTIQGGPSGLGTIFELVASANSTTTLASFNGANGAGPFGGLTFDSSGNFFGTTAIGGTNNLGTVFEYSVPSHSIETLISFDGANGSAPGSSLVVDAFGNLFGTTTTGGTEGKGTIFEIVAGTHQLLTLVNFDGTNGYDPFGGLTIDAAGNLFGTTAFGGSTYTNGVGNGKGYGTVFMVSASTHQLTTLVNFEGVNDSPSDPSSPLIPDANGNLYSATRGGGAFNHGTLFMITDAGFVVPETNSLTLMFLTMIGVILVRAIHCQKKRI